MIKAILKGIFGWAIRGVIRSDRLLTRALQQVIADQQGFETLKKHLFMDERAFQELLESVLATKPVDLWNTILSSPRSFNNMMQPLIASGQFNERFETLIGHTDIGTHNQSAREIWLQNALLKVPAGLRILDAGAGECQYRKFCDHLDYVSQDFAKYDGQGDQAGLQMGTWDVTKLDIVSDITQIPEPDGSFDAIMCTEVLEHLPDPLSALAEFSRLLKSGGVLIITAPFCSLTHFAPYHFSTGFSRYFYETHLNANGYAIQEITANGNYFDFLAQEVRRIPYVAGQYGMDPVGSAPAEELVAFALLKILAEHAQNTQGSSELLTYGYFIRATKQ